MRYFVSFLIVIGLIFLGVLVLIRLFFGGPDPAETATPKSRLANYAGSTKTVELTVDQPINADAVHRQVKIVVGTTQTTVRLITGYQDEAIKTETYSNNAAAYGSFLEALDQAGYTKGDPESTLKDERGMCPQGKRYVFEIKDGAEQLQRYWATSCGDDSNFQGESDTILRLFKAQIPDYRKTTKGLQGYSF